MRPARRVSSPERVCNVLGKKHSAINCMTENPYEIIRTVASCVSATGIVIAVFQLRLQYRIRYEQQARARVERTIEVIRHYCNSLTPSWAATLTLVEKLSEAQLKLMNAGQEFAIDGQESELLAAALPDEKFRAGTAEIHLSLGQSYKLRHQALAVFNALEIVFEAWNLGVAHNGTIKRQMAHLHDVKADPPTTLMKNYREACRTDMEKNYPALHRYRSGQAPAGFDVNS